VGRRLEGPLGVGALGDGLEVHGAVLQPVVVREDEQLPVPAQGCVVDGNHTVQSATRRTKKILVWGTAPTPRFGGRFSETAGEPPRHHPA